MPDGTLVPCTLLEWAEWIEAPGTDTILARTAIPFGKDDTEAVLVTTKFTGYDIHVDWDMCPGAAPRMYETHARHRDMSQPERRYLTEDDARKGHVEVVEAIQGLVKNRKGGDPIDALLLPTLINRPKKPPPAPDCPYCQGKGLRFNRFGMEVLCGCILQGEAP